MLKELLHKIDAKLLRRFGYYFGGLALGVVALSYINKQKGTTFNYGPTARVLSQIRLKDTLKISEQAQLVLTKHHLDSMDIQYVLFNGDWNRDKSHVHQKPCPDFWIDATIGKRIDDNVVRKKFSFVIERCEYTATIIDVKAN
ncbi:MAG: hypothetical protein ACN4EF_03585 [Wenyingzhuangia sp.]|jgi:hypothetical protein|uniref:hypothetical protein n=1 Tax=Wenyingzhuangia sp. TaxID=1964193 RepID=UPI00321BB982